MGSAAGMKRQGVERRSGGCLRVGSTGGVRRSGGRGPALLLWVVLCSSHVLTVHGQMSIPPEIVQKWAVSFGKQLTSLSARYSGAQLLQKKYKDVEGTVKMEEVDGEELVKQFAEEMEEMLGRKMKSVKFEYFNSMLINKVDEDGNPLPLGGEFPLEQNEHFSKLPVNVQTSNIQVPTNVYNRDPDIVNGVYMSEVLDDVFTDNFQKDPTLTWQYFGSATGFFRLYPVLQLHRQIRAFQPDKLNGPAASDSAGIQWIPDENGVVTFDCRNRNWYIQAATSPKDVVIVVDVSGSMKGLRLTIAKHTINTILDTLGENDFYSDYVRYVEPCFKGTLVQADLDNREHFKILVDELHVKGEGKVTKAMKESFKILNEATALGQGSLCNQAIMLITDGAMEDFEDVFEEFNWPEKRVRYYTHVSTLADVQENVMEYLHVLSRPMVINHDHDIIWTEAYMDIVQLSGPESPPHDFSRDAGVYSAFHGYAYLITNNGYILSHPDLRPLYKEGKKLKPKPNYNSVDLSEVEWEDTEQQLRTSMVTGETGALTLDVRASVDKGLRVLFLRNNYYYTIINETPFRTYCETDIDPAHRKLTQLQAVVRYLTGKEPDLECDAVLLSQTLFDAVVTAPMEAYWTALMLNASGIDDGVETAFLGTRSGLMRVQRYTEVESRVSKSFLTSSDKENLFTLDHFPLWYRRAAENPAGQFLYYMPRQDSRAGRIVISSTTVTVTAGKKTAIAAGRTGFNVL
ncbi:hypothetical protein NQD34_009209 [Periophthalmus magnuspinnatus]|nr:hypothetical protein NQD34_009209 [Periophthalmus magnuspinnatus]